MAGRIPQHFIDELLNRIDIVDVIDSRVPLRKAGRDFQARCPFHEEKNPSFTVSQNKQFYHCFGCGAHGSAINFLMEYEHLDFIEAIKELAQKAGVALPTTEEDSTHKAVDKDLYSATQEAADFFRQQLRSHADSAKAVNYLKARGLTGQIASEFGIGFAPPGWDNLIKAIGGSAQRQSQLATTGMTIEKEPGRYYDRFRNRIMFPIRDRRGRIIAFGGRVIDNNDTPKYLNSPESPLFHKGKELYGLYEVRQALRQIDRLLVVEGYMDVVALAQHGIRYAVATLGTALTTDHIKPLFHTTQEVIFCFDGDRAGRDAAWKALDIMLPELKGGRTARFMFLADGEDPDTLVREIGPESFEQQIDKACPLSHFLVDHLLLQIDKSSMDWHSQLLDLALPKLSKISNVLSRRKIIGALALDVSMSEIDLMRLLGEKPLNQNNGNAPVEQRKLSPVRTAITLLLNQPQLAQTATQPQRYLALTEPGIRLLVELLELGQANPHINCGTILEHWRDRPEAKHLSKLARAHINTPIEGMEAEFQGVLRLLDRQRVEQEYEQLLRKSETGQLTQEEKLRIGQLQAEKRALAQPQSGR